MGLRPLLFYLMMTVTLANLKLRARRKADMENSAFISDAELLDLVNEAYCELYDVMTQAFERYYTTTTTFSTTPGTTAYALPGDFYKLLAVDLQSGNSYITMYPYDENERNSSTTTSYSIPTATIRMRYIPTAALFAVDSDARDFVNGWEALLVTDVAIMMLEKEESATDALERRRERQYRRLTEMAQNRDVGQPGRVQDVTLYDMAYIQDSLRYRLYGQNIELMSVQYTGV